MDVSKLNSLITISTYTETVSSGDITPVWGTPVSTRAHVEQVDGSRYLKEDELTDRIVYRIKFWDNAYSNNIRVVYSGITLYPIRPLTKNPGKANMIEVTLYASTKV
jgi:hypothetical protein